MIESQSDFTIPYQVFTECSALDLSLFSMTSKKSKSRIQENPELNKRLEYFKLFKRCIVEAIPCIRTTPFIHTQKNLLHRIHNALIQAQVPLPVIKVGNNERWLLGLIHSKVEICHTEKWVQNLLSSEAEIDTIKKSALIEIKKIEEKFFSTKPLILLIKFFMLKKEYQKAKTVAEKIVTPFRKVMILARISILEYKSGRNQAAKQTLKQAIEITNDMSPSYGKDRALFSIAVAKNQMKLYMEAKQTLISINHCYIRCRANALLATPQEQLDQFKIAIECAERIRSCDERSKALVQLSLNLVKYL